ncbi:MAG: CapA family protein [Chloroflexi bacterium]|nr:CapA family protein [Chloroflexota bacterium]
MLFVFSGSACQPHRSVTLVLLGDINLGRGVTPTADSFAFLTSYLSAADVALANLESPLGGDQSPFGDDVVADTTGYNLCASADRAAFLADWGLDLLSLANNHQNDCALSGGENEVNAAVEGRLQTQTILANFGLTGLAPEPTMLEINGLTLAFFAFDDVSTPLDADAAVEAIHLAHENGALAVVSVHWGAEYQGAPTDRQEALACQFAEAGATLIWGHHPHVLQPAEWVGSTLVLYSLGNALFDQGGLSDTRQSALVLVTLDADGVTDVQAIPFEIDVPRSRLVEPDAETAENILERVKIK